MLATNGTLNGKGVEYFGSMTRVWLAKWEWACCGDAFKVGDDVDFGIETRTPEPLLAETLGPALVATVDAIESHHEKEFTDRVRGQVVAVHEVTREVIERKSLRQPGHGAPNRAVTPHVGGRWPLVGSALGSDVRIGSRPPGYIIEITPVPDTAILLPVHGVPLPIAEPSNPFPVATKPSEDLPPERRVRTRAGWLIDVEEH